jgi:hypothetical protein
MIAYNLCWWHFAKWYRKFITVLYFIIIFFILLFATENILHESLFNKLFTVLKATWQCMVRSVTPKNIITTDTILSEVPSYLLYYAQHTFIILWIHLYSLNANIRGFRPNHQITTCCDQWKTYITRDVFSKYLKTTKWKNHQCSIHYNPCCEN